MMISLLGTQQVILPVLDVFMSSLVWYFSIFMFLIIGIVVFVVLYRYSKNPIEWKHQPCLEKNYDANQPRSFVNRFKKTTATPVIQTSDDFIQKIFFEKIHSALGYTADELLEMKTKNPQQLRAIIRDKEIADWILTTEKMGLQKHFFKKHSHENYIIKEKQTIIKKMEAW